MPNVAVLRAVAMALIAALVGAEAVGSESPGSAAVTARNVSLDAVQLAPSAGLDPELEAYRAAFVSRLHKHGPADAFWPSQSGPAQHLRCQGRDAQRVEAGEEVRDRLTRMILTFFQPMTIDAETGIVRFSGLEGATRWDVVQRYGQARDLILRGGHPSDGIWVRAWKQPLGFILIENSQIVVTGTCHLAP